MRKPLLPRAGLSAIVLAAGGSTRLGRPKQMLRFRTEPLVVRAARLARKLANDSVVVVVGADHLRIRAALRHRFRPAPTIAYNAAWRDGMAGSIRAGLAALPAGSRATLILLVDQPQVGLADLERLLSAWRRSPRSAAASAYAGRSGVPAVIPERYFAAMRSLQGDAGARHLLRELDRVVRVEMPAAAFDVDTAADAAGLSGRTPSI